MYDGKKGSEWVKVLIDDTSARKRALAVEALAKLWAEKRYEESLPNISRSLRLDSSAAVRAQAAIALGALKEDDIKYVGKDLIDALGMEKDSRVRKEIAIVMNRYPVLAKAGVTNLTAALKDSDPVTRIAVAEALGQAGSDAKSAAVNLAPMLVEEDKSVRLRGDPPAYRRRRRRSPRPCPNAGGREGPRHQDRISVVARIVRREIRRGHFRSKLLTDKEDELPPRAHPKFGVSARLPPMAPPAASVEKLKDIRDIVRAFGSALAESEKSCKRHAPAAQGFGVRSTARGGRGNRLLATNSERTPGRSYCVRA